MFISFGAAFDQYGTDEMLVIKIVLSLAYIPIMFMYAYRCWLSEEDGAIWAFIAPMLLIILV